MTQEKNNILQTAIKANLDALAARLIDAASQAQEASEAMAKGEQNLAFGTIFNFENLLAETQALYNAAVVLHRSKQ